MYPLKKNVFTELEITEEGISEPVNCIISVDLSNSQWEVTFAPQGTFRKV